MRRRVGVLATATAMMMAFPTMASAHPDHGGGSQELFPGEGVVSPVAKQHEGDEGHLPAKQQNVDLIGKAEVTNPSGDGITGRVADVFAYDNYAYLTAFREPTCEAGGVHVMDMTDIADPREVQEAFIPTSEGSYAGEGIQVLRIAGKDVLIHQNETCDPERAQPGMQGGINLWDVSDPRNPQPLAMHAGDYTSVEGGPEASANTVHSMYAWTDNRGRFPRSYVALVDNEEAADVDIMDITDPANPVMINDSLDLVELFGVDQESPAGLDSIFSHDMTVERVGSKFVMNVSYWDGGYVLLDVTDPRPGRVQLVAETDFAELDEERLKRGFEISPEGNAHQSELSRDHKFMIGTDEDFNPYRVVATIDEGPYAGVEYTAASAGGTPPVSAGQTITGTPTYVGQACEALPPGEGVALIERGVCPFQVKLDTIVAAGYTAGIVFNIAGAGCDGLVSMAAEGEIPFVFVSRTSGLQLLGQELSEDVCAQEVPAEATSTATTIQAVFDGWGYVRLFSTDIPRGNNATEGAISQLDTYAIPESQDPGFAEGFGDLSVHEVAMDPEEDLAYLSYYSGGLRVVEYGEDGLNEVGAFVDEGGSNFWGVEVYQRGGQKYILASDRDYGLYIFQYGG